MKKYQLSVTISKVADQNSAASKAVTDCSQILHECGYEDYNLVFQEGINPLKYYCLLFINLFLFYIKLEKHGMVAVQYPMLNNIFKYFIKISAFKKVTFFCITHDIESLRLGGNNEVLVKRETANLNYYHYIIVHNNIMQQWLKDNGVIRPMIALKLFDYLSTSEIAPQRLFSKTIVFAGNLAKSQFIYQLGEVADWRFNIYGPNYKSGSKIDNIRWCGEYLPEEILVQLDGDFGLIWDGNNITVKDSSWGNYLNYNNPHKFSLYLAAGLPVIAPADSAIAELIRKENVGLLINNLHDISQINITKIDYIKMKNNCLKLMEKVTKGYFFKEAVKTVEQLSKNIA